MRVAVQFLIPVLLLAFIGVLVVSGLRGAWLSAFVSRRYTKPHCPACRYEIDQALPVSLCPECGRDLRIAGVLTPELVLRLRGSFGNIWGGVGLAAVVAGLVAGGFAGAWADTSDTMEPGLAFVIGLVAPVIAGVPVALMLHRRRKRLLTASGAAP